MPNEKRLGGEGCFRSSAASKYPDFNAAAVGIVAADVPGGGMVDGPQIIGGFLDCNRRSRGSGPKLYNPRNPSSAESVLQRNSVLYLPTSRFTSANTVPPFSSASSLTAEILNNPVGLHLLKYSASSLPCGRNSRPYKRLGFLSTLFPPRQISHSQVFCGGGSGPMRLYPLITSLSRICVDLDCATSGREVYRYDKLPSTVPVFAMV